MQLCWRKPFIKITIVWPDHPLLEHPEVKSQDPARCRAAGLTSGTSFLSSPRRFSALPALLHQSSLCIRESPRDVIVNNAVYLCAENETKTEMERAGGVVTGSGERKKEPPHSLACFCVTSGLVDLAATPTFCATGAPAEALCRSVGSASSAVETPWRNKQHRSINQPIHALRKQDILCLC